MNSFSNDIFSLKSFEGPLDLLWHLIHREEIDIYEVSLKEIIEQYLKKIEKLKDIDSSAEFIALTASLIWLKSHTLLPSHEHHQDPTEIEYNGFNFEGIHHLLDYCRFKQAAKSLSEREQQQSSYYFRGIDSEKQVKKNLGIDHLSIEDLSLLFKDILSKITPRKGTIKEEIWRVSDKLKSLRYLFKENQQLLFYDIFSSEKSKEELIVTFLALLELMKNGELRVIFKENLYMITNI